MNYRLTCYTFLTLILTLLVSAISASAQGGKPRRPRPRHDYSRTPPTNSRPTMTPNMSAPDTPLGQRAFISGKVVLDDGTHITESANIQTICRGQQSNRRPHRFTWRLQFRVG